MKIIIVFLLMVFGCSRSSMAQLDIVSFPYSYLNTSVKNLSLGNATVSFNEIGNQEINPAVEGEQGTLHLMPTWHDYAWAVSMTWKHRGLNAQYSFDNSTVGLSVQRNEAGDGGHSFHLPYIFKYANHEIFVQTNYSYSFDSGFIIGAGINYLYSSKAGGTTFSGQRVAKDDSWSIDLGANYQFSKTKVNNFTLSPHLGISLSDFGTPVHYTDSDAKDPMPTTLRIGGGTNITLNKKAYGRDVIELSVMQNVSKILARIEQKPKENGVYFDAMNPFKALIKSWGTYEYHDGSRIRRTDFFEQLWWHSGVELKLLETIALRWGYQKAGKAEEPLSYRALGVGIDLYYLVFDYTNIKNDEDDNLLVGHHWQITGRIPLDGTRPDTILDVLFD